MRRPRRRCAAKSRSSCRENPASPQIDRVLPSKISPPDPSRELECHTTRFGCPCFLLSLDKIKTRHSLKCAVIEAQWLTPPHRAPRVGLDCRIDFRRVAEFIRLVRHFRLAGAEKPAASNKPPKYCAHLPLVAQRIDSADRNELAGAKTWVRVHLGLVAVHSHWQRSPLLNRSHVRERFSLFKCRSNSLAVTRYLNAFLPLINNTGTSAPNSSRRSSVPSTSISTISNGIFAATSRTTAFISSQRQQSLREYRVNFGFIWPARQVNP